MAEDSLKAFMAENAIKVSEVGYVASKRFLGADREPVSWRIQPLTSEQCDEILTACKKKEFVPGTRDVKIVTDTDKFVTELVTACVTYPNLNDAGLQNSYGAIGAADLVHKMLTPGEYMDLGNTVQQANGYDVGMGDKIKRAKN